MTVRWIRINSYISSQAPHLRLLLVLPLGAIVGLERLGAAGDGVLGELSGVGVMIRGGQEVGRTAQVARRG